VSPAAYELRSGLEALAGRRLWRASAAEVAELRTQPPAFELVCIEFELCTHCLPGVGTSRQGRLLRRSCSAGRERAAPPGSRLHARAPTCGRLPSPAGPADREPGRARGHHERPLKSRDADEVARAACPIQRRPAASTPSGRPEDGLIAWAVAACQPPALHTQGAHCLFAVPRPCRPAPSAVPALGRSRVSFAVPRPSSPPPCVPAPRRSRPQGNRTPGTILAPGPLGPGRTGRPPAPWGPVPDEPRPRSPSADSLTPLPLSAPR